MRVVIILFFAFSVAGCQNEPVVESNEVVLDNYFQVTGFAQGTTYSIIYQDSLQRDLSGSIDSLLKDYDSYLSTYVDTSLISSFNKNIIRRGRPISWGKDGEKIASGSVGIFEECFIAAKEIYYNTNGAFDPSIYPLVNYWGFFSKEMKANPSQYEIDSILKLVDFSDSSIFIKTDSDYYIGSSTQNLYKTNVRSRIDFNGIAQGHSVDIIGRYLKSLGIENYMVEIGGEVLCKGVNNKNTFWQIGVDKPIESSSPGSEGFQMVINVKNKAVATSGNYRKFYEKDGVKYAHTINPKSGYPVQHSLLSVTVMTDECVYADGYATAFMVMGMEESKEFILNNPDLKLDVYLIEANGKGQYNVWMTNGFKNLIKES